MAIYKSKTPTKDGRQYFFRIKYKDIFGEVHDYSSGKFKSSKEAKNEEAIYRIKIANQEICTSSITIKQAWLELRDSKAKQTKKQTVIKNDNLFKHLTPIENKKINDFNISMYKQLSNYIEGLGFCAQYNNKILGLLRQIIIYSNKNYNTSDAILKYIENCKEVNVIKDEMQFFTIDEYKQFDGVIDNFDYHVFFELLYYIGLRQGEAQALIWKDIDFEKKEVKITKTLMTKIKGEKWTISSPKTKSSTRILPLIEKLVNDLKIMQKKAKEFKDYSDNWFVFGNSIPFKESTIQKKKNNYCTLAGVKQIRIHDFRHSCASLLINKGASIALVSKYLGHANISITLNTYTHMFKSELENITDLLNNL